MAQHQMSTREERRRRVENGVPDHAKALTVDNCGFDRSRRAVEDFFDRRTPAPTRRAVLHAGARFENFLQLKTDAGLDYSINEKLLIEFFESYLWYLIHPRTHVCVFDCGSFFPIVAYTKRFIYLKYAVDLGPCRELNRLLKKETFGHQPTKKEIFTLEELTKFVERKPQDGGERQESLLVLCSFFGLGRSAEVIMMTKETVSVKSDSVVFSLFRCAKSRTFRTTKVVVPNVGKFDTAREFAAHLASIPDKPRLWWTWRQGKFVEQPMGKNQITVIAKKVALFLQKDPPLYASHSFRRSGATAMVEGGASTDQLMVSGAWASQRVAHGYIQDSDRAARERTEILTSTSSSSQSSSSSGVQLTINLGDLVSRERLGH